MTTQKRPNIPAATERAVKGAFNGLCAICGRVKPQIHHIDEDRTNNDPMNLIPLCPNHHLSDQHDPTRGIDQGVLRLFRLYRDPFLLKPQFQPLFKRMMFLLEIDNLMPKAALAADPGQWRDFVIREINSPIDDLLSFVSAMNMGSYYSSRLPYAGLHRVDMASRDLNGRENVISNFVNRRDAIVELIVELLRFQNWPSNFVVQQDSGSYE